MAAPASNDTKIQLANSPLCACGTFVPEAHEVWRRKCFEGNKILLRSLRFLALGIQALSRKRQLMKRLERKTFKVRALVSVCSFLRCQRDIHRNTTTIHIADACVEATQLCMSFLGPFQKPGGQPWGLPLFICSDNRPPLHSSSSFCFQGNLQGHWSV